MKKIICIFGTRPEAIKMAPVIKELKRYPEKCRVIVCVTAQHRYMLDQVLSFFNLKPDIDLNIMRENQSLDRLTSVSINLLTKVISKSRPSLILVQGDTTSAMSAALAGFYRKIPIGHIEAGLRTDNIYDPFPEEVNRKIISILSVYNFAPTKKAQMALLNEGVSKKTIFVTGNTIVDALKMIINSKVSFGSKTLQFPARKKIILVTAHRRENFGKPLENICYALKELSKNPEVVIIYPVHPNPNVKPVVSRILGNLDRVRLLTPLVYPEFIQLLNRCYLVLTDSGGVQEEASVLTKPVLVLRNETERQDGIEAKVAKLVGTNVDNIVKNTMLLLKDPTKYKKMSKAAMLY